MDEQPAENHMHAVPTDDIRTKDAPVPEDIPLPEDASADASPVTMAHLQEVADFINQFKLGVNKTFMAFDARLKELEGASPHDRIVSAAIDCRVEAEALTRAHEMAQVMVREALAQREK